MAGGNFYRSPKKRASSSPGKDIWDKVATLTVPFVTLVVGAVGSYATWSYNRATLIQRNFEYTSQAREQRARDDKDRLLRAEQQKSQELINQAQLLQQLFTFVSSDDPQKREFGYAMFGAVGQGQLAARLIAIKGDKAGLAVLKTLAIDKDPQVSKAANAGLATLAALENVTTAGNVVLRQRSSCREFAEAGFRTPRVEMQPSDVDEAAKQLGAEPAALAAFLKVETTDSTLADGRPRILFERHLFSRMTGGQYDKSHPDISNRQFGGYKGGAGEYDRLTRAAALNCPAALAATSWGMFQIIGSNAKAAGYEHVDDYVKAIMSSGKKELAAGIAFIRSANLVEPLRARDWDRLAYRYNGANYKANHYAEKMAAAYTEAKAVEAGTN